MKARILRPEEWGRLKETGQDWPVLLPYVEPQNIAIAAVENGAGDLAASVCALQVTHFEGLWIRPDCRGNAGVFRSLIRQAYAIPRVRRERWVFGGAKDGDEKMDRLCSRLDGWPLPLKFYALPVGV